MSHYGYTCDKCPNRGTRGDEDEWVSYTRQKGKMTGYRRSINLSWAERCKTCNARYNSYKRARESVMRLEIIRKTYSEFGGTKWKYLKFLTVTWPIELTDNPTPDIEKMKSKWIQARSELIGTLGALGGTDVCEVVSKQVERPGKPSVLAWSHNIHFHSIWLSPFVKLEVLQKAMKDAGIGRHEYTILKEQEWVDERGNERTQEPYRFAIEYLTKYLTKSTACKRMVWGELRSWKQYLDEDACKRCIKTTHDLNKEYPCKCIPDVGASKEHVEDS